MAKRPKPLLARPTEAPIDTVALVDRILRRYPITMARLREAELREAEEQSLERHERGWDEGLASSQSPVPRRRT
jgi:hypothetical protein